MATSVAPLTTSVMSAVPEEHAGVASAINNAVARVAGVMAIAIFGLVAGLVFNHELDRRLAAIGVQPAERAAIDSQRRKLAAIETGNQRARRAIGEAFVEGYRTVMWIAAALAVASSVSAAFFIDDTRSARAGP
jgi:hypothetical protein